MLAASAGARISVAVTTIGLAALAGLTTRRQLRRRFPESFGAVYRLPWSRQVRIMNAVGLGGRVTNPEDALVAVEVARTLQEHPWWFALTNLAVGIPAFLGVVWAIGSSVPVLPLVALGLVVLVGGAPIAVRLIKRTAAAAERSNLEAADARDAPEPKAPLPRPLVAIAGTVVGLTGVGALVFEGPVVATRYLLWMAVCCGFLLWLWRLR